MTLPASFAKDGFLTGDRARLGGRKFRRLMLGTEGQTDTGKSEFSWSAPGPGVCICLDRGFDAALDNPEPPPTRNDFGFVVVSAKRVFGSNEAVKGTMTQYWSEFYNAVKKAIANDDVRTLVIDGDSDSWEIQRLADLGALTGIYPQTKYSPVYAARRAFYSMLWDSGKIIIATNKVKDEWETVTDGEGNPVKDSNGEEKRRKTGNLERQGFPDQDYLWQIHVRHLFKPGSFNAKLGRDVEQQWGLRITKCKANKKLEGEELWGPDCNFASLVQFVYPQVPLEEWGF